MDIAKCKSIQPVITVHNWLRGRDIVEFLGLWEVLHNPGFKRIEFDTFKENAGTNAFVFSIKGQILPGTEPSEANPKIKKIRRAA